MKKILLIVALLALVSAMVYYINLKLNAATLIIGKEPVVIGFALGATREERWFMDRDLFVEKAQALGAVVDVSLSDYDPELQATQIENLVSQGVKVIVVIAADSDKIAPAINKAHQAGVKIIAYDHLINNADVDLYVSFDNVKVGRLEAESIVNVKDKGNFAYIGGSPTDNNSFLLKQGAMSVLDPKIKSGDINLVLDKFTDGWKPDEANKTIKNYLETGKNLDAVVAANDGTAFGVVQALHEKNLAGKIPVSGQDAELSACQRIVEGTQTSTVYKPIKSLAEQAAISAVAMANSQSPNINNSINNGFKDVPSFFLEPILVDKDNMENTVIKDGFHSQAEVYKNIKIKK
jgi:D-xylose transport system substrate-binding protein